jgi:hypothetical protein
VTQAIHLRCGKCGHEADVPPHEGHYCCPDCGAVEGLTVELTLPDTAEGHDFIKTKGRDEHGKEFLDAKAGDSYFEKGGEWRDIVQVVNRQDRTYRKKVIRKSTGEVLRDEYGPLDQHEPTAVKRRWEQGGAS